jgi:subtilase family serine protease
VNVTTKQVKKAAQGIVAIRITVANVGDAKAARKTLTQIRIDGQLLGSVKTAKIKKGKWLVVKFRWDTRQWSGEHLITLLADSTNRIDERREDNNSASYRVTVRNGKVIDGVYTGPGASG